VNLLRRLDKALVGPSRWVTEPSRRITEPTSQEIY
jgi:hypothetical protein